MPLNPLALIAQDESANGTLLKNPNSSASGIFQDVNGTWRSELAAIGGDPNQYPTAISAPASLQAQVNAHLFNTQGWAPWASNQTLMADVAAAGGVSEFAAPGTLPTDAASYAGLDTQSVGQFFNGGLAPLITAGSGGAAGSAAGAGAGGGTGSSAGAGSNFNAFTWVWNTYQDSVRETLVSEIGTIQTVANGAIGPLLILDIVILGVCAAYAFASKEQVWSKLIRAGVVVALLGTANLYNVFIVALFTDFPNWLGRGLGLSNSGAGAFDTLVQIFLIKSDHALSIIPWWTGAWWEALVLICGSGLFLGIVLIVMWAVWFLSQAFTEILFIIGPVIALALLWDYTRHLFDNWLSELIHLALLSFAAVVVADLTLKLMIGAYSSVASDSGATAARSLLGVSLAIFGLGCAVAGLPMVLSHISRGAMSSSLIWRQSGAQAAANTPSAAVGAAVGAASPANIARATAPAAASLSRI